MGFFVFFYVVRPLSNYVTSNDCLIDKKDLSSEVVRTLASLQ